MCVYVHMFIYIHTHIYIYIYVCMYVYDAGGRMSVCMYVTFIQHGQAVLPLRYMLQDRALWLNRMLMGVYMYVYVYVCMCVSFRMINSLTEC
jgi:hypothetical protein